MGCSSKYYRNGIIIIIIVIVIFRQFITTSDQLKFTLESVKSMNWIEQQLPSSIGDSDGDGDGLNGAVVQVQQEYLQDNNTSSGIITSNTTSTIIAGLTQTPTTTTGFNNTTVKGNITNNSYDVHTNSSATGSYNSVMTTESTNTAHMPSQRQQQQQHLLMSSNWDKNYQPIQDILCHGCRTTRTSSGAFCIDIIKRQLQNKHGKPQYHYNDTSILNAVNELIKMNTTNRFTEECPRCLPNSCSILEKEYYHFDKAFIPVIHKATTLALHSIPPIHRIPPNVMTRNLTEFFSHKSNVYPSKTYYFEYNPSIVQLPENQIPNHLKTSNQNDKPVYIASFRVTNMQQCIYGDEELQMIGGKWPRPKEYNYLGLALLRNDLSIIEDVVIKMFWPYGQDFRLFNLNNQQLYITTQTYIQPIWLVYPNDNELIGWYNSTTTEFGGGELLHTKSNVYPSNLTIITTGQHPACLSETRKGKNIVYFVDNETNETIAEIFPMGNKEIVNLNERCNRKPMNSSSNLFRRQNVNKSLPIKSFGSLDELHFAKGGNNGVQNNYNVITTERGSACCVRIPNPYNGNNNVNDFLYLGISHSKHKFINKQTRDNLPGNVSANHFYSSLYAFEPYEPYTVRSRTGRFCLGFSSASEKKTNPYCRNNFAKLRISDSYYNCPAIHFVSGITEKVGDSSRVIISYGVSDCSPRFIEVTKDDLMRMLFPYNYQQQQKGGGEGAQNKSSNVTTTTSLARYRGRR